MPKNCNISAIVRQISKRFGKLMQKVCLKCMAVKNYNFKNPRMRTVAILKIEKSHYFMMMQNESLKHIGRCSQETHSTSLCRISWISAIPLQRYGKFCDCFC